MPFKDWQSTSHSLTIWIHRYPHPSHKNTAPGLVKIHLYICAEEFRLKLRLCFGTVLSHLAIPVRILKANLDEAEDLPQPADIATYEKYFSCCVSPMFNEMALHTFIMLCRMIPTVFSAFANMMMAEMVSRK